MALPHTVLRIYIYINKTRVRVSATDLQETIIYNIYIIHRRGFNEIPGIKHTACII